VRGGGLLVGCALALVLSLRRGLLARRGLPEAALLCLLAVYAWALLVAPVPLWVAVPVAVVASALVLGALLGGADGPVARLLARPGPVSLGRVSYSLYLWHYPFFRTLQRDPDLPAALVLLLEVVLSLAAAVMSYTVVEQPLARWSARHLHRPVVPSVA
jgi:peptidoglycan/LPS O-acetylase OafA/YrhL